MSSLLPTFRLPLQRRLTKIYTDTKSSYDFFSEPPAVADPSLSSLHRKLRIQKDRLVSWGLSWSESSQSPDIDESLSQAGLGDVVASVMSTIKDILAEAEPLWSASRTEDRGRLSEKQAEKSTAAEWDRGRFEDLVKDLTSSIDTLYDLSRARQSVRQGNREKTDKPKVELPMMDEGPRFEASRMEGPQAIDAERLRDARGQPITMLPPTKAAYEGSSPVGARQIAYLRRQDSSKNPWKLAEGPAASPVIVEFAAYDDIYSSVGIPPPMNRFEKLFAGLSTGREVPGKPEFGVLNLLGYFEDHDHSQFGLVYELPGRFQLASLNSQPPVFYTLADMLAHASLEPALETKYRLAYNLATSVFDLHSKGVVHGNLSASSVTFFQPKSPDPKDGDGLSRVNVRRPYLSAYDLFPEAANHQTTGQADTYRHPLDPRLTPHTVLTHESRSLDLYSLAMLLLEIGLWSPSKNMAEGSLGLPLDPASDVAAVYKQLAARCGSTYLHAVRACWRAIDDEMTAISRPDVALQKVYGRVLSALECCCAIDDESEEEEMKETETSQSLNMSAEMSKLEERSRAFVVLSNILKARDDHYKKKSSSPTPARGPSPAIPQKRFQSASQSLKPPQVPPRRSEEAKEAQILAPSEQEAVKQKAKMRRFPANKILQEHLDFWHTTLMPQINYALRGFYRKYPESVEISLESIGEVPQTTKPTILVICTSVGKVRGILKKNFIYDSSTYGLMVCRGKIVRSRKNRVRRSINNDGHEHDHEGARNPQYQERPTNGASIAAFAEDMPLNPVSLGGLIMIDNQPFGLSVHHMLDVPEDSEDEDGPTVRSSGQHCNSQSMESMEGNTAYSEDEDEDGMGYEISDCSETSSIASTISDQSTSSTEEPGDIEGIAPEDAGNYFITQPAIDDVPETLLPSNASDGDYLASFILGNLYSSSGLRRREKDGLMHEIDWALFQFNSDRMPEGNRIPNGEQFCPEGEYPTDCVPTNRLGGLKVHGIARTSGLRGGKILEAITSVKIYGRQTPSQSWQVSGGLGVPGDSGAWVLESKTGKACGSILAWSDRKRVAYFCPMDVVLEDIKDTLKATWVGFPTSLHSRINNDKKEMNVVGVHTVDESPKSRVEGAPTLPSRSGSASSKPEPFSNVGKSGQARRSMEIRLSSLLSGQTKEDELEDLVGGIEGMHVAPSLRLQS